MKTNKKILAEGFATIIMVILLSALLGLIAMSGVIAVLGEVPGFTGIVLGAMVFLIVVGIVVFSVVFFLVHLIRPDVSALVAVLAASVVLWIVNGSWSFVNLVFGLGMVLVGNWVAKRIKLDKKLLGMR